MERDVHHVLDNPYGYKGRQDRRTSPHHVEYPCARFKKGLVGASWVSEIVISPCDHGDGV